ncbi:MAG TPA: hypothetical protein VJS18_17375 [Paraburkholderia sp.]|nr:hypothetical protein [Paraburkholderia sp.]
MRVAIRADHGWRIVPAWYLIVSCIASLVLVFASVSGRRLLREPNARPAESESESA